MMRRNARARRLRVGLCSMTLAAGLMSCSGDAAQDDGEWRSPIAFDTATIRIVGVAGTTEILAEVARSSAQQQFGLMTRPRLDESSGMIFVYSGVQEADAGFWMFRTLIPLDIAYIDSAGRIASIRAMSPCPSEYREECPVHAPGERYLSALEVNNGFFERHGIAVGDSVALLPRKSPGP